MIQIPQCQHLKPDGLRCGSPALRGRTLCYFHSRPPKPKPKPALPGVPDPSDPMAVLDWTIRGLMTGKLDTKAAAQIIYGVQQMCAQQLRKRVSLKRSSPEGGTR